MKKITVMVVPVGKAPERREIDASLKSMQAIVGGYIEQVPLARGLVIICDEEGKLKEKPLNRLWRGDVLVGDFFVTRTHGSGYVSLTPQDEKAIKDLWWFP